MEPHDRWFALVTGMCFFVFAKPYGRALGNGLEGPSTGEQRATDVRRHTFIARIFGVALVGYAVWRFIAS
jgi:uncharacterized membrane protein